MRRDGDAVSFTLEDDGAGVEVDQVMGRAASERGLGLAALNERARMLGGTCKIYSRQGAGTKVVCSIPVSKPAKKSAPA